MNGKTDKERPLQISRDEYRERHAQTFRKRCSLCSTTATIRDAGTGTDYCYPCYSATDDFGPEAA